MIILIFGVPKIFSSIWKENQGSQIKAENWGLLSIKKLFNLSVTLREAPGSSWDVGTWWAVAPTVGMLGHFNP